MGVGFVELKSREGRNRMAEAAAPPVAPAGFAEAGSETEGTNGGVG